MEGKLHSKKLTYEVWKDFEELFNRHNGVRGGCWCTFYLCKSSQFDKMSREERREYHKRLIQTGKSTGILIYLDEKPVGWCQVAGPKLIHRFDTGRDYSKLNLQDNEKPDWRISCIFTDKNHRKQGIGKFAASEAMKYIESEGGGVVEVFPFDLSYRGITGMQHNGSVSLFKNLGFNEVTRLGKNTVLMRKTIGGRDGQT